MIYAIPLVILFIAMALIFEEDRRGRRW